jgi:cytochrome c55X
MRKYLWLALLMLLDCMVGHSAFGEETHQQLRHLLKHDCGSCHGLTLQGGLGPSLRPEALAGKSDEMLLAAILHGRPGTTMPPWKDLLSEVDARVLVTLMRAGEVR